MTLRFADNIVVRPPPNRRATERIETGDMRNAALILDPALLQAAELRAASPILGGLIAALYIAAVLTDLESLRPNTKLNIAKAEFILTHAAQQGGLPVDLIGGIRGIELLSVDADGAVLRGTLDATGEPVDAVMVQVHDEISVVFKAPGEILAAPCWRSPRQPEANRSPSNSNALKIRDGESS
jgi:hypothetical protein